MNLDVISKRKEKGDENIISYPNFTDVTLRGNAQDKLNVVAAAILDKSPSLKVYGYLNPNDPMKYLISMDFLLIFMIVALGFVYFQYN